MGLSCGLRREGQVALTFTFQRLTLQLVKCPTPWSDRTIVPPALGVDRIDGLNSTPTPGSPVPTSTTLPSRLPSMAATRPTDNGKGAAWMTLGMAGYVVNDSLIKLTAENLPLFQAIFVRGVMITAVIGGWTLARGLGPSLPSVVARPVLFRVATEALGTAAYLTALTKLPLAGLTAVLQIVPLAVTFVAARVLREPVSTHRVAAVSAGFLGVLLIVRPWSDAFSPWYLLGLIGVVLVVLRELATIKVPQQVPSLVVALATAVTITAMGLVVTMGRGWAPMGTRSVMLLAAASLFLTVGYIASVITVRVGELSFSAPFRYTVLLFAILLQVVVFGEVPDALSFVGSAIIVAAGLWSFSRERTGIRTPAITPR